MGADFRLRPATEADCRALAPLLRTEDAAECDAAGFVSPLDALLRSLAVSEMALAVELRGELAAVCGVSLERATMLGGVAVGVAWALTGSAARAHKRSFLRASEAALEVLARRAPVLVADVDARYAAALRWARWLGFEVSPARGIGPDAHPFHRITRRPTWVQ